VTYAGDGGSDDTSLQEADETECRLERGGGLMTTTELGEHTAVDRVRLRKGLSGDENDKWTGETGSTSRVLGLYRELGPDVTTKPRN